MTKYKKSVDEMITQNRQIFEQFQKLHDNYTVDPKKWQKQFNIDGQVILDIIRRYENRLCANSQNSGYGKFTTSLSEKFHDEVKKLFPKIDFIGMES